jgi:D-serine deaminase-like pyridoxal phosphate-dependent protein
MVGAMARVAHLIEAASDTSEAVLDLESVRRNINRAAAVAREHKVAQVRIRRLIRCRLAQLQLNAGSAAGSCALVRPQCDPTSSHAGGE